MQCVRERLDQRAIGVVDLSLNQAVAAIVCPGLAAAVRVAQVATIADGIVAVAAGAIAVGRARQSVQRVVSVSHGFRAGIRVRDIQPCLVACRVVLIAESAAVRLCFFDKAVAGIVGVAPSARSIGIDNRGGGSVALGILQDNHAVAIVVDDL